MSTSSSSTQAQAQLAQAVNALTQITTQLAKTVMQQQQQQQLVDSCFGGPVTGAAAAAVDATNGWVVVPQQYQQQQQHQQVGATTGSCFPGMFPGSKIAGCSSGDGNAARAVVTVHGGIWGQFRAGGFGNWSEWMVLSDPDTTSWSAVSVALTSVNTTNQTSGLAILALDNHGVIHMKYRWGPQGTLWTSWTTVDTTAIASPVKRICASIWGPNIIVLAATSTSIWMLQYNFASASGTQGPTISTSWTDLGSGGNSTYTAGVLDLACAQLPNSLGGHLFAVCSDGIVRSRVASTISTTNFDNWGQTQASAAATQISIAPYSDQRLQIIAVMQSDGSLQYNRKTSTDRNASWSGWNAFPVTLNGVLTAAIYPVGAGQQIDVISSKGTIFSTSNSADQTTGWSPWTPLNDTTRPAWTISQINTDISGAAVTIAGGAGYDGQTNTPLNAVMSGSYVVCCHSIGAVLIEEYGCNDIGQSFLRINGQYMLPMNLTSTTSLTLSLNSGNSTVTINGTTIPIICCIRDTRSFNVALANITNLGTVSLRQTWNQDAMTAARSIGFPDICLTNRTIPVCCDQYKIMMRSLQFPTSALFESVSQLSGWWSDFKTWIAKNWIVVLVGAILVILLGLFIAATAGGGGIITGAFIAAAGDDAIAATVPALASYASDVAGTTVTNAQVLDAFAQGVNAANGQAAQSAANIVNLLLNL